MTLDDIDLNMLTERLGWYLEVFQTQSILIYWLASLCYGYSACQGQKWQIIKHFDFDLICDVVSDP